MGRDGQKENTKRIHFPPQSIIFEPCIQMAESVPKFRGQPKGSIFYWLWGLVILITSCQPATGNVDSPSPIQVEWGEWTDASGQMTPSEVARQSFQPSGSLHQLPAEGDLWISARLQNETASELTTAIQFRFLTQVTLYESEQWQEPQKAGFLVPRTEIDHGPDHFKVELAPFATKRLYLKIEDRARLQQNFTVETVEYADFVSAQNTRQRVEWLIGGAFWGLILYTFCSFFTNIKAQAYLWLGICSMFLGLYSLSLRGYIIAWLSPENPVLGWAFNETFYQLALVATYILGLEFYEIRKLDRKVSRVFQLLVLYVTAKAIFSFFYIYFTLDSGGLLSFNIISFALETLLPSLLLIRYAARFSLYQRFVVGALLVASLASVIRIIFFFLDSDQTLMFLSYIADFAGIGSILIFSIGFVADSRRNLEDRNAALAKINRIQQNQNKKLEKLVEKRTQEVTQANESLQEQNLILAQKNHQIETLIHEIHHRVKNNFQLITNLLETHGRTLQDDQSLKVLEDSRSRIQSMALLHQRLYEMQDHEGIKFADYAKHLVEEIASIFKRDQPVQLEVNAPPLRLKLDMAVTLGILMNELITNAFKYGFTDDSPRLRIDLIPLETDRYELVVWDNGNGFEPAPKPSETGFGLKLVRRLTRQLRGQLTLESDEGMAFRLIFQDPNEWIKPG